MLWESIPSAAPCLGRADSSQRQIPPLSREDGSDNVFPQVSTGSRQCPVPLKCHSYVKKAIDTSFSSLMFCHRDALLSPQQVACRLLFTLDCCGLCLDTGVQTVPAINTGSILLSGRPYAPGHTHSEQEEVFCRQKCL